MALRMYEREPKKLKQKVGKLWGLILTFAEVTLERIKTLHSRPIWIYKRLWDSEIFSTGFSLISVNKKILKVTCGCRFLDAEYVKTL